MSRWKNLLFIVLLILIFIEILIIFPHQLEKKIEPKPSDEIQSNTVKQKMKGVHLVESQKGSRDWELYAEDAIGTEDQGSWDLKKVKVHYYNKEKVDFIVTGESGSLEGKTKNMKISGKVVTKSANGYVFQTETVLYEAFARKITSPGRIQMIGPKDSEGSGLRVNGEKMIVLVDENVMSIENKVFAQRQMNNNKILMIKSERVKFSGVSSEAYFMNNIQMRYGDLIITGSEAKFIYDVTGHILSNIQVVGNVKVVGSDKIATSENLNIDLSKSLFRFLGRPKIIQDDDELTGEEIIFLDGGKQVKVQNVKAKMESQK